MAATPSPLVRRLRAFLRPRWRAARGRRQPSREGGAIRCRSDRGLRGRNDHPGGRRGGRLARPVPPPAGRPAPDPRLPSAGRRRPLVPPSAAHRALEHRLPDPGQASSASRRGPSGARSASRRRSTWRPRSRTPSSTRASPASAASRPTSGSRSSSSSSTTASSRWAGRAMNSFHMPLSQQVLAEGPGPVHRPREPHPHAASRGTDGSSGATGRSPSPTGEALAALVHYAPPVPLSAPRARTGRGRHGPTSSPASREARSTARGSPRRK